MGLKKRIRWRMRRFDRRMIFIMLDKWLYKGKCIMLSKRINEMG